MPDTFDVLAACGRARVAQIAGDGASPELPLVGPDAPDAAALIAAARDQGMLGLLADQLRREEAGRFSNASGPAREAPAPNAGVSAERAAVNAAWRDDVALALQAGRVMAHASEVLAEAGVPVLAYKGPGLSLEAYGDAALRSCEDVDLVVAPDARDRAAAALAARGYLPAGGKPWRDARDEAAWLGHAVLVSRDSGFPVELHWRFCDRKLPWTLPVADVIARANAVELGARRISVPERHDAVVLLLLHAARHGWDRLEGLVAPAALAARGLDGRELLRRASRARGVRAVLTGLHVARQLLGLDLPVAVADALQRDPRIAAHATDAIRRLGTGNAGTSRDVRLHLELLDSAADRLRYSALALVDPTPDDYRTVALPRPLRGLYFVVRPLRLLARGRARR